MNRLFRISLILLIGTIAVVVSAPRVSAQWPAYATPAVPKTADGKPDLTGPTPRTAEATSS